MTAAPPNARAAKTSCPSGSLRQELFASSLAFGASAALGAALRRGQDRLADETPEGVNVSGEQLCVTAAGWSKSSLGLGARRRPAGLHSGRAAAGRLPRRGGVMAYTWGRPTEQQREGRNGRTNEERGAEVEALTEQLHAKVLELTSSDAWLRMLAVGGRFHRYSWRNQMLLWMQAEDRGPARGGPGQRAHPSRWRRRAPPTCVDVRGVEQVVGDSAGDGGEEAVVALGHPGPAVALEADEGLGGGSDRRCHAANGARRRCRAPVGPLASGALGDPFQEPLVIARAAGGPRHRRRSPPPWPASWRRSCTRSWST